jgi:hypothetical protein
LSHWLAGQDIGLWSHVGKEAHHSGNYLKM